MSSGRGWYNGELGRQEGEGWASFSARISATFASVIQYYSGDIDRAGDVYGVSALELLSVVRSRKALDKAYVDARLSAVQKERAVVAREERKSNAEAVIESDEDYRTRRKVWPADPDKRASLQHELMMLSLLENEGNLIEVAECLSMHLYEVTALIDGSKELQHQKERGRLVAIKRAEAMLERAASNGHVPAIKAVLAQNDPGKWGTAASKAAALKKGQKAEDEDSPRGRESGSNLLLSIVKGQKNA